MEFADRFSKFSRHENQEIFQTLFAPKKKKGKG
jgi:hypothetical protein